MKQAITAVLILLTWTGSARAWSEDGHRIVCAIAWKELAPETRALGEDLLKPNFRTLGSAGGGKAQKRWVFSARF